MKNLKSHSLLLLGAEKEWKLYFEQYFRDVILMENYKNLTTYYPIIFLFDNMDIAKKIRKYNKDSIIAFFSNKIINKKDLIEALPLRLLGFIEIPFKKNEILNLLNTIDKEIEDIHFNNICLLKNNYLFDFDHQILYDENRKEIKLTKKEKKLINILVKSKKQFVSSDTLEYNIWEEESMKQDCKGRFKVLLNGLRKKLPKDTIINNYGLGYKIK
jgi:DNA-binding response OmpR family regulator